MTSSPEGSSILIIGGSGFVSGTLARLALDRGHRVWAVTRGQKALPDGVTGLIADRHDAEGLERTIRGAGIRWDLVVDCIGYELEDMKQDIALFRNLAAQFVFVSTDFVFDPRRRKFPQPEESDYYLTDGYGGNKRLCELELAAADTGEMQWTVFRPCHIYGPGSELGCLPLHGRDPQLISRLKSGEALKLVGGGYFLQQPILARDLAEIILSVIGNDRAKSQIFQTAGPDIIESREYYRIIADILGVELKIAEVPVDRFLEEHPESSSFMCHRIYDLKKLAEHGLKVPSTSISQGLREHVQSLLNRD